MNDNETLELLIELKVEVRNLRAEQAETRMQLRELQREFDRWVGAKVTERFDAFEKSIAKRIEELAVRDERHSQQIFTIFDTLKKSNFDLDPSKFQMTVNMNADSQQNQVGDGNNQQ